MHSTSARRLQLQEWKGISTGKTAAKRDTQVLLGAVLNRRDTILSTSFPESVVQAWAIRVADSFRFVLKARQDHHAFSALQNAERETDDFIASHQY